MAHENSDLMSAFIADIEKKIASLQAILVSLKSASALGALGTAMDGISMPSGTSLGGDVSQPIDLPEGAFLGKSVPACVKLYLSAAKRKKTVKEIASALRDGGIESTSDNFDNVVTGALFRLKNGGEVLRFKDGWGLPEWYPAHIRAAAPSGKQPKKKSKKNGRKIKSVKLLSDGSEKPASQKGTTNGRILQFLQGKSDGEYSLAEIAGHIGIGERGARLLIGKLVKAGRVKMSAPGMYRGVAPWAVAGD